MSGQASPVVELKQVSKVYESRYVLSEVNLEVTPGEIVGLIGKNGSGKTTLLRLAAGLVRPSAGEVVVQGQNLTREWGRMPPSVGILFDPPGILPHLSGLQNLLMLASLRRVVTADVLRAWMQRLGLDPESRQRVAAYSQGMRQRLGLAQAFMESPGVYLLDEPTNALDPDTVDHIAGLLLEERQRGAAVIVASHDLNEIARLCDRVWKVDNGALVPVDASLLERGQSRPLRETER